MNRQPYSNPVRSQDPDGFAYARSGNPYNNYPPPSEEAYGPRPSRRSGPQEEYRDSRSYRDGDGPGPQRRSPPDRAARNPRSRGRSPRQSGRPSARGRRFSSVRRLRKPYRYGALASMMVFAALGGMCLALSGVGGAGESLGLLLAAVPAFLLSLGCAALYVYF